MSKASELRLLQGRRSIDAPVRFHNRSGDSEEAGSMLDYYARSESAEEEYLAEADEEAKGVFVKAFQLYLKKTLSGKERRFLQRILSGKEKPQEVGRALGVKWFDYMQEIQRKAFNNAEAFGRVVRLSGWSRAEAFAGTVFARFRALRERGEREELPREKKQAQARAMMKAFGEAADEERRTAKRYSNRAWDISHPEKVREAQIKYRETHRAEMYARNEKWRETHAERVRELQRQWNSRHREQQRARDKARYAANPEGERERVRKYREENREAVNARKREYDARHREEVNRRAREYKAAHREEVLARQRRYREANREKLREQNRGYREANPEQVRERSRRYNERHREERNAKRREYQAEHKEEMNAKSREYWRAHHEELIEKNRTYKAAHAEEIREYQRAYREKKKAEKEATKALAGLLVLSQVVQMSAESNAEE